MRCVPNFVAAFVFVIKFSLFKNGYRVYKQKNGFAKIRKPAWILVETRGIEPLTS